MLDFPSEFIRLAALMLNVEPEMVQALVVSGVAGAFVRAVAMPEPDLHRRIRVAIGGALCALFVGGIVGHMLNSFTGAGTYAFLAAGFFLGEGGLVVMYGIRDKILGGKK